MTTSALPEWAYEDKHYDFRQLLRPALLTVLDREWPARDGDQPPRRGRLPGTGTYPTRESFLARLLPAYRRAKGDDDVVVPMKDVKSAMGLSVSRIRGLRRQWGIKWPPE